MEVLVALGLFALGFAAVAAIFPAGALLQRQTADDVRSRQVGDNTVGIVLGTPVSVGDMEWYFDDASNEHHNAVEQFPQGAGAGHLQELWDFDDRTYPAAMSDPLLRPFHWVPLVRNRNGEDGESNPDWELYAFVMRRQDNRNYAVGNSSVRYPGDDLENRFSQAEADNIPQLIQLSVTSTSEVGGRGTYTVDTSPLPPRPSGGSVSLDDVLSPGDWLLDDAGNVQRVYKIDDDKIIVRGSIRARAQYDAGGPVAPADDLPKSLWFAPAGGRTTSGGNYAPRSGERSPTRQIYIVQPGSGWGTP